MKNIAISKFQKENFLYFEKAALRIQTASKSSEKEGVLITHQNNNKKIEPTTHIDNEFFATKEPKYYCSYENNDYIHKMISSIHDNKLMLEMHRLCNMTPEVINDILFDPVSGTIVRFYQEKDYQRDDIMVEVKNDNYLLDFVQYSFEQDIRYKIFWPQ